MIGTDIASISRIKAALENPAFKRRVFTQSEIDYCDAKAVPENSYAGIFCAKEAASKAVRKGFGTGMSPSDIEVGHDEFGAPILRFYGGAREMFKEYIAYVSISHDGDHATATVLLERKGS